MKTLPSRPLGFGEIVGGAFQLYRRDFALYYVIALLAYLPGYVLSLASSGYLLRRVFGALEAFDAIAYGAGPVDVDAVTGPFGALAVSAVPALAISLAGMACVFLGSVALTAAMGRRLDDQPVSLERAYRLALRHLLPAAGAAIAAGLIGVALSAAAVAIGIGFLVAASLASLVLDAGPFGSYGGAVLVLAGAAVLVLLWKGATFAILPAVVVENHGVMGAISRSVRLWRGAWLRVMGVQLVAFVIANLPVVAMSVLTGTWGLYALMEAPRLGMLLSSAGGMAVATLTTPFAIASVMALFHDRRMRTEITAPDPHAEPLDAS